MKRQFIIIIGLVFAFIRLPISQQANASSEFSPIVKVRAYETLLNGQINPFSEGSGTIIDSSGLVLTNAHVVVDDRLETPLGAFSICVSYSPELTPDCRFTASLLRYDLDIDLALLQIDETPLWDGMVSAFPFIDYQIETSPSGGDLVSIGGFPVGGVETIVFSQGTVAGTDLINGYDYLVTNAPIFQGNSGGVMLDLEGRFLGVPTFVLTSNRDSGRVLHPDEARKWINSESGETVEKDEGTLQMLIKMWLACYLVNLGEEIRLESYPNISMTMPDGWHLDFMNNTEFISFKKGGDFGYFSLLSKPGIFDQPITLDNFELLAEPFLDLESFDQRQMINISGNDALQLTKLQNKNANHIIYFPYGHGLISMVYGYSLEGDQTSKTDAEEFLESLVVADRANSNNQNATNSLNDPNYSFNIIVPDAWKILKSDIQGYNLAEIGADSDFYERGLIDYFPYYRDVIHEKGINPFTDASDFGSLLFHNNELVLDGLKGSFSLYKKEGSLPITTLIATLQDPEYELRFLYEVESGNFEEVLSSFAEMLSSFQSKRYDQTKNDHWKEGKLSVKGDYFIPNFNLDDLEVNLSDISGDRFEGSIRRLFLLGIIQGHPGGYFGSDELVSRAAALKMVLESKKLKDKLEGQYIAPSTDEISLPKDVPEDAWYKDYVLEALAKNIISGYPDGTIQGDKEVNLAEALKMISKSHQLTDDDVESEPWYQVYVDAGNQYELIPEGLDDPAKPLTRGELSYMID